MNSLDIETAKTLAKEFSGYKEEVGKEYINTFKILKRDLNAWYDSLTIVCFTVGAVALTFGADKAVKSSILYPGYFWLGALLLIFNGALIFWFRKLEVEKEFAGLPNLRQTEADYWKAEKILQEVAKGNTNRYQEYEELKKRFTEDYKGQNKKWSVVKWISTLLRSSMTDVTYGLMIFPILLMASQFIDVAGISFKLYKCIFFGLISLYLVYATLSASRATKDMRAKIAADKQIEDEIL